MHIYSIQIARFLRFASPILLAFLLAASVAIGLNVRVAHASGFIGPKKYFMAIGNSITFGYQHYR